MKKINKSILGEIEDFLIYLLRNDYDENKRSEKNLKQIFGEENYKRIYSLIGERKTGALLKKDGGKRILVIHINDEGLKFLEERKKEKRNDGQKALQIFLTFAIFTMAFLQGMILMAYYFIDILVRGFIFYAIIFASFLLFIIVPVFYSIKKIGDILK